MAWVSKAGTESCLYVAVMHFFKRYSIDIQEFSQSNAKDKA
jgi:hypothetical protein